jgi:hypothetical protein
MALPDDISVVVTRNLGGLTYLPNQRAAIPKQVTAVATSPTWKATIDIVIEAGRPVVENVSVHRVDGGPEISSSTLREVPVASIVRNALTVAAFPARSEDGQLRLSMLPTEGEESTEGVVGEFLNSQRRAPRSKEGHLELLMKVASEYRKACADPLIKRPRTHVATVLNLSSSYIGKLVSEARRTDPPLLNNAPGPGKAGEVESKRMRRG